MTLLDREFAGATSQTSETSSSQLSSVQTIFSRGHEPFRNKYIELAKSLVPSNGVYTIRTVIEKRTGIKALAKIDQRPDPGYLRDYTLQRVYRMLRSLCKDERYFVNPLETIEIPSGFAIITEYRNAQLLEACEPDLTNTELLLLFAQIGGGALQCLHKHGLVHSAIKSTTILIEGEKDTLHARLTGFSESKQVFHHSGDNKTLMAGDIHMLSRLVYAILRNPDYKEMRFPELNAPSPEELLSRGLSLASTIPSPTDIISEFERWIGDDRDSWPPFTTFVLTKTYAFDCFSIEDKSFTNTFVPLDQVVLAVYELQTFPKLPKYILHHLARDVQRGLDCLPLRQAAKLFHVNQLIHFERDILEALEERSWDSNGIFTISCTHAVDIHYHRPSSMINLTDISRIVGHAGRNVLEDSAEPKIIQEIDGFDEWKGIYVDLDFAYKVLRENPKLHCQFKNFHNERNNPYFDRNFQEIDFPIHVVLAFPRLQPHLVLIRRTDGFVNIDTIKGTSSFYDTTVDHFIHPRLAAKTCYELQLKDLASYLDNLSPIASASKWKEQTYLNRSMAMSDSSITSPRTASSFKETEQSLQNPSQFRFKRDKRLRQAHWGSILSKDFHDARLQPLSHVTFEVPTLLAACDSLHPKDKVTAWLASMSDLA
ncbi:MAG: hypothetical protein Q9209_005774 [Squamulea sp. 1 TL-2023]